jgi:hypothetical protein
VVLAKIDLPAIERRLQEVAADIVGNDPKKLRERITQLEEQLRTRPAPGIPPGEVTKMIAVAVENYERIYRSRFYEAVEGIQQAVAEAVSTARGQVETKIEEWNPVPAIKPPSKPAFAKPTDIISPVCKPSNGHIKPGLRRIMVALAQAPGGLAVKQVGLRARISSRSGSFDTYLSIGRTSGWIVGGRDRLTITPAGVEALGSFEKLPATGPELLTYWLGRVKPGAARILQTLVRSWPNSMSIEEVGNASDISYKSGSFDTYLSTLRGLELVDGPRGALVANRDVVK